MLTFDFSLGATINISYSCWWWMQKLDLLLRVFTINLIQKNNNLQIHLFYPYVFPHTGPTSAKCTHTYHQKWLLSWQSEQSKLLCSISLLKDMNLGDISSRIGTRMMSFFLHNDMGNKKFTDFFSKSLTGYCNSYLKPTI